MKKNKLVIGIEGPAAAGKSTMAASVSKELGFSIVEGGKFYRQLTLLACSQNIEPTDTEQLSRLAESMPDRFTTALDGTTKLDGKDVTHDLQDESISKNVGNFAQNLEVRKIIDQQIIDMVNRLDRVIIVGRHLKKFYPEAAVLHVTIDPTEANRRHQTRTGKPSTSVTGRNTSDAKTSQLLGMDGIYDTTIDVTNLTPEEQAEALKEFINAQR